ncbi:endonuclease/exonuclease/phosphatase family protein [Spartinivicinus poritis]|uniref:Endonuclease/exonuclease/phosphatase family protein n=1 Tax=Spartinivicinus poritis TaxID=2994640 RepID=A0ABT5UG15_9GAMM|nr:endonuclease/exonuclease/phosphatase family protein [Spartinivicinus sp. A2-2]MDE1465257.1 endonuclease/exonuclease/phosphatase family protein [Spartinivicinus sp. A2-2]
MVLAGLVSFIGLFGKYHWLADLINHFRWYYLAVAISGIIVFSLVRKWHCFGLAIMTVGLNYEVIYLYKSQPNSDNNIVKESSAALSVAQINANFNNTNTTLLLQWLQQRQPDIVAVEEYTPVWAQAFKQLEKLYPYKLEQPRNGGFGIALFSRYPVENLQIQYFGPDQLPSITGVLIWQQHKIQLLVTHPVPPMSQSMAISRDLQLEEISLWLKNQSDPVVLLGDLNTTPWGHSFKKLIDAAELKSTRTGVGLLPSWPSKIPLIPIDHILLSKTIRVISIKVGPDIGSDHLPVIAEIGLKNNLIDSNR